MISLQNKPDIETPSVDYPFGSIQDRNGTTPGTPVSREVYGDFHQFFQRMMQQSGITINDLPDNATNGYQLHEALMKNTNADCFSFLFSITQIGTFAPGISQIGGIPAPWANNLVTVRSSAGEYEITCTPSFTSLNTLPQSLMLIASSGDPSLPFGGVINCRFEDNKIRITTTLSGTPTDSLINNYTIELKWYVPDIFK